MHKIGLRVYSSEIFGSKGSIEWDHARLFMRQSKNKTELDKSYIQRLADNNPNSRRREKSWESIGLRDLDRLTLVYFDEREGEGMTD